MKHRKHSYLMWKLKVIMPQKNHKDLIDLKLTANNYNTG